MDWIKWVFDGIGTQIVGVIAGLIIGAIGGGAAGYRAGKTAISQVGNKKTEKQRVSENVAKEAIEKGGRVSIKQKKAKEQIIGKDE